MEDKKGPLSLGQVLIPIVLTAALLWYLFASIDFGQIWGTLGRLSSGAVALAGLLLMAANVVCAVRWWLLMRGQIRFRYVLRNYMCSRIMLLLPAGVLLADATRVYKTTEHVDVYSATSTILVERLTSTFPPILYVFLGASVTGASLPWAVTGFLAVFLLIELALLFLALAGMLTRIAQRIGRISKYGWGRMVLKLLHETDSSCQYIKSRPKDFGLHLVMGLVFEALLAGVLAAIGGALAPGLGYTNWLWIHSLTAIAMFIPASVGGVGMREGSSVVLMGMMGIGSGVAMAISLSVSALNIVNDLVGGAVYLAGFLKKRRKTKPQNK